MDNKPSVLQGGGGKGQYGFVDVDRIEKIVSMRLDGSTYEAIATYFGVTKERIRQLLKKYEELTGAEGLVGDQPRELPLQGYCEYCRYPIYSYNKNLKHCSMACSKAHTHDKHLPRVQKVIELRMKGVSWIRCAEEVGWGTSKTGTSLLQWIKVQYPEVIQSMSLETYKKVFPRSDPKRDGVLDVINLEKAGNKNC